MLRIDSSRVIYVYKICLCSNQILNIRKYGSILIVTLGYQKGDINSR